jgi:NAD(P)-dependent dehydrogenase (short-subunit alcohol dehydrogenase family)
MSQHVSTSPIVLVTGATDGIGYVTARRFVDDGATVYLHAPDPHSGEKAMTLLVKDGAEPLRLNLVIADFTRLDEIADLADMLTVALPGLDVLVNNAAVAGPERRTSTPDGNEVTFQVNYLAAYVLTTKLAPKLASACGRVVNVSSVMHRGRQHRLEKRGSGGASTRRWRCMPVKLALTMYTRSLAEASEVSLTALSVHPGMFATRLLPVWPLRAAAKEAATILTTLSSPTYPVVDGGYYARPDPTLSSPMADIGLARDRLEELRTCLVASVLD